MLSENNNREIGVETNIGCINISIDSPEGKQFDEICLESAWSLTIFAERYLSSIYRVLSLSISENFRAKKLFIEIEKLSLSKYEWNGWDAIDLIYGNYIECSYVRRSN